jgi:general L-amino acid transport system permease protein
MIVEHLNFLLDILPNLLIGFPGHRPGGMLMSLILAFTANGLGFIIAALIGSGYFAHLRVIRWASRLYVEIFRGLPLILLLLLIYLVVGSRRFGLDLSPRAAALIALALYSGAYQAEIVRAGMRAVPSQMIDAARVMGSHPWQVHLFVKMRYTLRIMAPAFAGQAISLFKDTSVLVIIGVAELMTVARSALGSDVANAQFWVSLYLFVGFLYFCFAFGFSQLVRRWERKNRSGDLVHSLANY